MDDIEIICVDNKSTDNSKDICLGYYNNIPSKIVITEEIELGANNARQKGLDLAQGEFVMFLDSDDCLELNACEVCYNLANKNEYDLIEFSFRSILKERNNQVDNKNGIMKFDFKNVHPLDPNLFYHHKGMLSNLFIKRV